MATASSSGVPGIPLQSLSAIQDPNTRQVLQSLVDGWHMRNGLTGNGSNQFVTKADLTTGMASAVTQATSAATAASSTSGASSSIPGAGPSAASIAAIISQVQAEVMASKLWSDLGSNIGLIQNNYTNLVDGMTDITVKDANGYTTLRALKTSTDNATAGVATEQTARANNDNAIASAVNTIWSNMGNNQALVQTGGSTITTQAGAVATAWQQLQSAITDPVTGQVISSAIVRQDAETAVSATGVLSAQWSVKTDVNGYISGFGLSTTANDSTPTSMFLVRADTFAIGSPTGPGIAPVVPFTVLTTPDQYGNPPGVYIDSATIAKASIGTAYIADASVNTLKILGNSVTVPVTANGPTNGHFPNDGSYYTTYFSTNPAYFEGGSVFVTVNVHCTLIGSNQASCRIVARWTRLLYVLGIVFTEYGSYYPINQNATVQPGVNLLQFVGQAPIDTPGYWRVDVDVTNDSTPYNGSNAWACDDIQVTAIGCQR